MIASGSRYADSAITTVDKDGQPVAVIVPGMQQPYSFRYASHQVSEGDRLDNLAYQYYGDPTVWWRIADANPDVLYWDVLTPGIIIRIPAIS